MAEGLIERINNVPRRVTDPMDPDSAIREAIARQGWSDSTAIDVMAAFIRYNALQGQFHDFLERQMAEEDALAEAEEDHLAASDGE